MTKKEIEALFLNEARLATHMFPDGAATPHENPDFLIGDLGVEVTELCREAERGEAARLGKVAPEAEALYVARPGMIPVNVSPVFSPDAHDMSVPDLATALSDFVATHTDKPGSYGWHDTPRGFLHIGVFLPGARKDPWLYFRAGDTVLATRGMLEDVLARKNARAPAYRTKARQVWLLVIDNLFLGPGEVVVREEDLAEWTFEYQFDKVLVFVRQPGGSGRVIDVRRT